MPKSPEKTTPVWEWNIRARDYLPGCCSTKSTICLVIYLSIDSKTNNSAKRAVQWLPLSSMRQPNGLLRSAQPILVLLLAQAQLLVNLPGKDAHEDSFRRYTTTSRSVIRCTC